MKKYLLIIIKYTPYLFFCDSSYDKVDIWVSFHQILKKNICCRYSVEAILISAHNICFYGEIDNILGTHKKRF